MDPRVRYVLCKHKIALEFFKLSWQLNRQDHLQKDPFSFAWYMVSLYNLLELNIDHWIR